MTIIRKHILIFPKIIPKKFPGVATKLGCEELYLFDATPENEKEWKDVTDNLWSFLHYYCTTGSIPFTSSKISEEIEGIVQPNTLIAISLDSYRPILLMDAIWQTIVELSSFHRESDRKGRLSAPITCILYSIDQNTGNLVTRPLFPFWDPRFLTIVQALKSLNKGGTKTDILEALEDRGIPFNRIKITRIMLALQNWLNEYKGFCCESQRIDGKRTNFYKLKEPFEFDGKLE